MNALTKQADAQAGFEAVIALRLYKSGLLVIVVGKVAVDDGIVLGRGAPPHFKDRQVIEGLIGRRQFIDSVAGRLAPAATDAAGDVMQHGIAIGVAFKLFVGGRPGRSARGAGHSCGAHPTQKFPA